jgi:four helix bundle protein
MMKTAEELSERLLKFAIRVARAVQAMPKNSIGRHIGKQLLRSATSPGANYEEACGAESRADFAHKIGIVLKEIKESRYWLRFSREYPLVSPPARLDPLLKEVEELAAIFGKSLKTAKKGAAG